MPSVPSSEKWIEQLPSGAAVALAGIVVALLGAIDAELFGIPADSIRDELRVLFVVAGGILFFAGIWKFVRDEKKEPASAERSDAKELEQQEQTYSLVMTTPKKHRITKSVTIPLGEYHSEKITFMGSVIPRVPETGVWILHQRLMRETKKGTFELERVFPYEADVKKDGSWSCTIDFRIWPRDKEVIFRVWAVVPTRDVLLLFKHHWENRENLEQAEKELKEAKKELEKTGSKVNWKRNWKRWIPLPADYLHSSLADTPENARYTVVLIRTP